MKTRKAQKKNAEKNKLGYTDFDEARLARAFDLYTNVDSPEYDYEFHKEIVATLTANGGDLTGVPPIPEKWDESQRKTIQLPVSTDDDSDQTYH